MVGEPLDLASLLLFECSGCTVGLIVATVLLDDLGHLRAHLGRLAHEVSARAAFGFRGVTGQLNPVDREHLAPDQPLSMADREHLCEQLGDRLA